MTEEMRQAYEDWFLSTFGVPVTHEYPLRYSDTAMEQSFEAGAKYQSEKNQPTLEH